MVARGAVFVIAIACLVPRPSLAVQSDAHAPLLAGATTAHRSGPLHFDYELLAYRGLQEADGDRAEAVIAINVDGARLTPSVSSRGWGYAATARLELLRDGAVAAEATTQTSLQCTGRLASAHGVAVYLSALVQPGLYDYRLEVTDPQRQRGNPTSRAHGRLVVPSFAGPGPSITALAVATDSVDVPWEGTPGGLRVNPTHLVVDDSPPLLYFEVYGVQPGAGVWTDLTFEPLTEPGALDRLLRGRQRPYTIRYRDHAPSDPTLPIRSTLRLELASLRPGPYGIRAVVTEISGGTPSLPMTSTLRLADARRSGYRAVRCDESQEPADAAHRRLDGGPPQR